MANVFLDETGLAHYKEKADALADTYYTAIKEAFDEVGTQITQKYALSTDHEALKTRVAALEQEFSDAIAALNGYSGS